MAIGRAFYYGEGVEEDNIEAVKWLKLAAKEEVPKPDVARRMLPKLWN